MKDEIKWELIEKFKNGEESLAMSPEASGTIGEYIVDFVLDGNTLKAYVEGVGIFRLEYTNTLYKKIVELTKKGGKHGKRRNK